MYTFYGGDRGLDARWRTIGAASRLYTLYARLGAGVPLYFIRLAGGGGAFLSTPSAKSHLVKSEGEGSEVESNKCQLRLSWDLTH